ncbi:MAG: 4a-hydroxytetrahydrobiopterin dehydratase [Nitrosopumilaceae archaeon]
MTRKCIPCEGGIPSLSETQIQDELAKLNGWILKENRIEKEFTFETYLDGLNFAYSVGQLAEGEGHHPEMCLGYKKLKISLTTFAINGLSENDFILASKIDKLCP